MDNPAIWLLFTTVCLYAANALLYKYLRRAKYFGKEKIEDELCEGEH